MADKKKNLVIVESPAKARAIGKFLGRTYKVEASQGHVRDLPKSQIGVDVDNDFEMKYITIHGRGDILAKLRKEAKSAKKIYLATDPDREGEAISWHLAHALKIDQESLCRVEFHEITKNAVSAAVKAPRQIDMDLVDAQQARRALDRLVGYSISPLLWAKIRKGLSAGRVQSVATRLVVDREQEIEAFIPEEYWDVFADILLKNDKGKKVPFRARLYTIKGKKANIVTAQQAEDAKKRIEQAELTVSAVKEGNKKKSPAPPFTTSTLQQEASRKLNYTISRTMQVVQQLYEGIDLKGAGVQGLVTYIRTDSVRVSDDALGAVRTHIQAAYGAEYLPSKPKLYKGRTNAQDAHEAIRPTDMARTPDSIKESLSKEQYLLYKLVYNRFVASQMTDARYKTIAVTFAAKDVSLRYSGEFKVFSGFTSVYEESLDDAAEKKESPLPVVEEGQEVSVKEAITEQHFTQPPARFTEASLVRTLEENGIGRPSTYAPTIATVIARGYVSREKKRLFPTELGIIVTDIMKDYFAPVVDPDFTAGMESQLDAVEEGKKPWKDVLRTFYPSFKDMLDEAAKKMEKIVIKDEPSDVECELCGAMMVYKQGRYGRFLGCPNFPECRNTKPILKFIDADCPTCGARLLEKISKKNRKFYGCERYPDCDFVSWEQPINEKCSVCGTYMTLKHRKQGEVWKICANPTCRHHEVHKTADEDNE